MKSDYYELIWADLVETDNVALFLNCLSLESISESSHNHCLESRSNRGKILCIEISMCNISVNSMKRTSN